MSRGPGDLERRLRLEMARRPEGTPLRVLAGIAYAVGPGLLTRSQLTAARQVLSRLARRGEILAGPGPGGAKLWRTVAAAEADTAARAAEADAERARTDDRRRREERQRQKDARERRQEERHRQYREQQARQPPPAGSADPAQRAIVERAAKLMGMLGSDHAGERDAAATALERLRRRHQLDWADFLAPAPPWRRPKS